MNDDAQIIFTYRGIKVCKADHLALVDIDLAEQKLKERMVTAAKTLADNELNNKEASMLARFCDTTYPNSLKALEDKRNAILANYPKRKPRIPLKRILIIIAIILAVALSGCGIFFGIIELKRANDPSQIIVYLSPQSQTYHRDYYCSALTSAEKECATTLLLAQNRDYSPCKACCH